MHHVIRIISLLCLTTLLIVTVLLGIEAIKYGGLIHWGSFMLFAIVYSVASYPTFWNRRY